MNIETIKNTLDLINGIKQYANKHKKEVKITFDIEQLSKITSCPKDKISECLDYLHYAELVQIYKQQQKEYDKNGNPQFIKTAHITDLGLKISETDLLNAISRAISNNKNKNVN